MKFVEKLSKISGIKKSLIPSSYQIIGNILLVKMPKIKKINNKKKLGEAYLNLLPYVRTVCETGGISGEYREPKVKHLSGEKNFIAFHKEHGILYKLDVSKIMFSKGNLFERQRLIKKVKPSETIVDMFAGIGYFSLGIAKKAQKVVAIEKNPVASSYLRENIALNGLKNVDVILGDCKNFLVGNFADRIVMGYLDHTEKFLPYALTIVKSGGTIHFHNNYTKNELWDKPIKHVENACKSLGFTFSVLEKRKVKEYAPNVFHVVLDITVKK